MRAPLVLFVVALAFVGALLHPLALVLAALPWDPTGLLVVLGDARTVIANILGWALVAFLGLMLVLVVKDRLAPRGRNGALRPTRPLLSTRLAVGIIAYNEAGAIGDLVRTFKRQDDVVEVIVVDNNSSDGTGEIAAAAGARVIREPHQGYGFACIRALREAAKVADADVVVLTEGDATFSADDLPKFDAYIGHADMVVGTRVVPSLVHDGSQMDYFFTWGNIAVGSLLRFRFWNPQFLGSASLTDVGCTYRAIRKDSLQRILPDLTVGGHHFSPHMLLVALHRGLSVVEIPVQLQPRIGESKGAGRAFWPGLQVGLVMIWHILTYRPRPLVVTPAIAPAQHVPVGLEPQQTTAASPAVPLPASWPTSDTRVAYVEDLKVR